MTNDGATILKSIGIDNPAAKVLVDISKVQDDEVGDGTTSVVVLACELLKEAERLISLKIHPQTIIAGFRKVKSPAYWPANLCPSLITPPTHSPSDVCFPYSDHPLIILAHQLSKAG